jgi:hypothetical protein
MILLFPLLSAELWIRTCFYADPNSAFQVNADPDPGFRKMTKKCKILQLQKFLLFWSKILLFLELHEGRPSYRRSLQPPKENIQHIYFFLFLCRCIWELQSALNCRLPGIWIAPSQPPSSTEAKTPPPPPRFLTSRIPIPSPLYPHIKRATLGQRLSSIHQYPLPATARMFQFALIRYTEQNESTSW